MSRRAKPLPESRYWNDRQTASRLGRSASWLSQNHPRLRQLGFPARDEAVGGFPKDQVEKWIDGRAGIAREDSEESQMLAIIRSKTPGTKYGAAQI